MKSILKLLGQVIIDSTFIIFSNYVFKKKEKKHHMIKKKKKKEIELHFEKKI